MHAQRSLNALISVVAIPSHYLRVHLRALIGQEPEWEKFKAVSLPLRNMLKPVDQFTPKLAEAHKQLWENADWRPTVMVSHNQRPSESAVSTTQCIRGMIGGPQISSMIRGGLGGGLGGGVQCETTWEVVWEDGLNVRAAPAADAPAVGELDCGDRIVELEVRDGWVRHSKGWNTIKHESGIEFLKKCEPAQRQMSALDRQRLAEAQQQAMIEQVRICMHIRVCWYTYLG